MSLYTHFCVSLQRSGFSLLQRNEGGAAASLKREPATLWLSTWRTLPNLSAVYQLCDLMEKKGSNIQQASFQVASTDIFIHGDSKKTVEEEVLYSEDVTHKKREREIPF